MSRSVRVDGEADEQGRVMIHDLRTRRLFRVDPLVRNALEAFRLPSTVDEARRRTGRGEPRAWWVAVCRQLAGMQLLVTAPDDTAGPVAAAVDRWYGSGWTAAADYIWATYDFPFVDYSVASGRRVDRQRMAEYVHERADDERTKRYATTGASPCAPTPAALARLERPLGDVLTTGATPTAEATEKTLRPIMTVAFGRLRGRKLSQPGRAPAIRRTSPSGGSRHPTEGYILTLGVAGMPDGVQHFSTTEYTLTPVAPAAPAVVRAVAPDLRDDGRPLALVIATSVFERNMYRYREPRTFRSVHLDVGHVVGTVEIVAAHEGVAAERLYRIDYAGFDDILGLDPYIEATLCVTRIGGVG